jgi:hypothetical protein
MPGALGGQEYLSHKTVALLTQVNRVSLVISPGHLSGSACKCKFFKGLAFPQKYFFKEVSLTLLALMAT